MKRLAEKGVFGMGSAGAPWHSPLELFTVCMADSEKCDGCSCTHRTATTPLAPFGAGSVLRLTYPLGRRAETQFPSASPAEDVVKATVEVRPHWRQRSGYNLAGGGCRPPKL
ncbi:hypothetical protein NDU88_005478 [Pleurodeles waltl]|uniref:Uncharacterized protein n=1 Tax=Pleurodeles waltl TaxID=8319 RepID=A0AAV7TAY1_PLEWA|nr:hypothetical protein NDU88_005478 [Pleurodeles waltl]